MNFKTSLSDAIAEDVRSTGASPSLTFLSSPDQPEHVISTSTNSPPPGQQTLRLSTSLTLPEHMTPLNNTAGFSLDNSQLLASKDRSKCSAADCKNPDAFPSLKCQYCHHIFCPSCAPLVFSCRKSDIGHSFVSNLRNRGLRTSKVRSRERKPKRDGGPPWECGICTMLNGPQVLVCLGCSSLREFEAREGRNVCPMCTLVNEPGKTKCELCETDLVSKGQVEVVIEPE